MYTKIIDVNVCLPAYYEVKSIVKAQSPGIKFGEIAVYDDQGFVISIEDWAISVQDFWSTITWYIKVEDADRLVLRLGDVELLNSRVSYLANDGSWRLHTAFYP